MDDRAAWVFLIPIIAIIGGCLTAIAATLAKARVRALSNAISTTTTATRFGTAREGQGAIAEVASSWWRSASASGSSSGLRPETFQWRPGLGDLW
jgi:hypothetical protein